MARTITQRELRNDSASVLREVQAGETLVITRNGTPVAQLRPLPPRRFVPRSLLADAARRARRQDRLLWAASTWEQLPLDAHAARAYGMVFAAARRAGCTSRARLADLLIASTAIANDLPLYTRNPADFAGLEELLRVEAV